MKNKEINNFLFIFFSSLLVILCGVPWLLLYFLVSKLFAIVAIIVWILGILIVKGVRYEESL